MKMKKWFVLGATLWLAACQNNQPNMTFEKPDFSRKSAIYFDATDLKIENDYAPNQTPAHVEHQFPTTPSQALHTWANQRLRTTAGQNKLVLVIEDASVVQTDLPKQHIGWKDGFYVEPTKEYRGQIKATLKLYAPNSNLPKAVADVTVNAKESALENASPFDRQTLFNKITLALIYRFDEEMERQVNQYFKQYRIYK